MAYRVGAEVGMSLGQRVHMLSLSRESDRLAFVLDHVNRVIRAAREQSKGPARVSSNGHARTNGHSAQS